MVQSGRATLNCKIDLDTLGILLHDIGLAREVKGAVSRMTRLFEKVDMLSAEPYSIRGPGYSCLFILEDYGGLRACVNQEESGVNMDRYFR